MASLKPFGLLVGGIALSGVSIAGSLLPMPTLAACAPSPAVSGATITCVGTDTTGVGNGSQSNVTVNVSAGASVQKPGTETYSIDLGESASVVNSGTIGGGGGISVQTGSHVDNTGDVNISLPNAGSGVGIFATGNSIIENTGSIEVSGTDAFSIGSIVGSGTELLNGGTISVSGYYTQGVSLGTDGKMTNTGDILVNGTSYGVTNGVYMNSQDEVHNDGLIHVRAEGLNGSAKGIWGTSGQNIVDNTGTIDVKATGDTSGIQVLGGEQVTNSGHIVVVSDTDQARGVSADYDMDFKNSGTIDVSGPAGAAGVVASAGSKIDNSGIILAHGAANTIGIFVTGSETDIIPITNSGTITAGVAAIATGQDSYPGSPAGADIINSGTINGDIILHQAADQVLNQTGGMINGAIELGDGANVFVNSFGASVSDAQDVVTGGDGNGISNSGTISSTNGTAISVGKDNIVTNGGTIYAGVGGTGILAGEGNNIRNPGKIVSGGDGVVMGTGSDFANQGESSSVIAAGDALRVVGGTSALIINVGMLKGENAIKGGDGNENITNAGVLDGNVLMGGGDDTLILQYNALVDGNIDGGDGNDEITTSSGLSTINGKISNVEELTVGSLGLVMNLTGGSEIGTTTVEDGPLDVNGELSTEMTVESAGTLGGSATIIGNVQNAGTLSPGNSIGTFNITGNYTQTASGDLFVELGAASADKLAVTGTAALNGALSTALQADDFSTLKGKTYTVLSAGSITGGLTTTGTVQQGFWTLNVAQTASALNVTVTNVNVPVGATHPFSAVLGGAVLGAMPSQGGSGGGIIISGGGNTLPTQNTGGGVVVTGQNNTLPSQGAGGDGIMITGQNNTVTEQQSASLDYDDMGDWESKAASFNDNWSTLGDRTPAMAMPKTGTAEFAGTTKGELHETGTPEAFVVEGNVLLTANFASGLVNADFTDMEKIDAHGVAAAWIDFRARMSIADGTSEFAGTAGTDDGVWNGKARGGFYGDDNGMPGHAAGLWSISSPLGRALGGFMAKRQ